MSHLESKDLPTEQEHAQRGPIDGLVGISPAICDIRTLLRKAAVTDSTVLIQGESGTGKELVARALHSLSPRKQGPFFTLNCSAVPGDLIESELFGHKKGSFTGAVTDQKGIFRSAHTGTLFLDEIETTSMAMQVKLIRSIQSGEVRPVGETVTYQVDVRLIAATNRDLQQQVQEGLFREDFYYRINVFPIFIAPLRDRVEDIPVLAQHILGRLFEQTGKLVKGVEPAAMALLEHYSWPGNVRELENELERAHILAESSEAVSVRCLSPRVTDSVAQSLKSNLDPGPVKLKDAVEELERRLVREALTKAGGNRTKAAECLGLSRQGLLNKINKYGLESWRPPD